MDKLSDEQKAQLAVQFEQLQQMFAHRHGVTMGELVEATRWVKAHREYVEALKRGGSLALIGFLLSALLLTVWEGLKSYLKSTHQ